MTETENFYDIIPKYKEVRNLYRERRDCTVIAFAEVFKVSYQEAHKHMESFCGRRRGKGVYVNKVLPQNIKDVKFATRTFGCENVPKISLGQFIKQHPTGRYYVCVRGHALAVIDGVIHDHSFKPRRMVKWAMRVYI